MLSYLLSVLINFCQLVRLYSALILSSHKLGIYLLYLVQHTDVLVSRGLGSSCSSMCSDCQSSFGVLLICVWFINCQYNFASC